MSSSHSNSDDYTEVRQYNRKHLPLLVSFFLACIFAVLQGKILVSISFISDPDDGGPTEIIVLGENSSPVQKKNAGGNGNKNIDDNKSKNDDTKQRVVQEEEEIELSPLKKKKKKPPLNIVFFYGDDWRFDSIGALNPTVHTPNLDRLAEEGLMFTENAVTTSICWISRATLATGQHYARHKTKEIGDPVPFLRFWKDTLFGQLTKHGYFTGMIGKWQPGTPQRYMFNVTRKYFGYHYNKKNQHITDKNERDAIDFLQKQRKKKKAEQLPFALFVNFFAPHHLDGSKEQYFPQKKTQHLYQNTTIPFAPTCTEESWKKMPPFFDDYNDGRARWRDRFDEPSKAQTMIKNYFRLISGVDTAVGKVLAKLDELNLTNDTLVIFTTDNGYYHAEHGIAGKWYAHQESVRVPLIIKDPRMDRNLIGTRNNDLTLSIDLAPTMLSAAGIRVPDRMQGDDMSRLYITGTKDTAGHNNNNNNNTKEPPNWRRSYYYEYPGITDNSGHIPVQALVRKDFKYIYWPTHDYEELFHLPLDRYEEHDLARNKTFATHMDRLRLSFQKAKADAQ